MESPRPSFLHDNSGAVTVDWVVLTAALVGLGLAVMAVVSEGLEDSSGDIRDTLARGDIITTSFQAATAAAATLFGDGFADGRGDWQGGELVTLDGFGEVLRLGPEETASLVATIPAGSRSATLQFDMIGADDLTNATAEIIVNGIVVATYSDDHGRIARTDSGVAGITIDVDQVYTNSAIGSGTHGSDSRATYRITVDNPSAEVTFGVRSTTTETVDDGFFAIDDVSFESI
jgi:hypothetical protein